MDAVSDSGRIGQLSLTHLDHFPEALLEAAGTDLWRHLPGPTLFHLPGRNPQPLFVSVFLHGNETTGWETMQTVLRQHRAAGLPRSLLLFVGNIAAAKASVRTLPDQADYNRTWPGTLAPDTPEARLLQHVVETVARHDPFASIDIHNNTGNNPHYACINVLDDRFLHLARLFSRTIVYFRKPVGVQSAEMARVCPAVTVECGRPSVTSGVDHAQEFVNAVLSLSAFPEHPVPDEDIDLMQTFVILKVPEDASFSWNGCEADFRFRGDLDRLNFSELDAGEPFGLLGADGERRLDVLSGCDTDVDTSYFEYRDGQILLSRPAIPAMLTLDPNAVRLDCLGYLMLRIRRNGDRVIA